MLPINQAILIAMDIKGITQRKLAEAVSMPASTLSEFLKCRTVKLDITKAQSIANTLGCTLDYLVGDDAMNIDVSEYIRAEREEQGLSTADLARETKINEVWILKFESGDEDVSTFLFGKICEAFGMTTYDFLLKYDIYDEYIPPQFNGDVNAYEAFKRAEQADAMKEKATYPELNDIVKNGWYTIDGLPARRSYRLKLQMDVWMLYKMKYTVTCASDDDDKVTMATEMLQVVQQLAKTPEDKELVGKTIERFGAVPDQEKFGIVYPVYQALLPNINFDDF